MHRNIARAYDYFQREHNRVRAAHVKILAQNDRALSRLFRASLDSPRHLERVLDLNRYGRKLQRIMNTLLRL